MSKKLEQGGRRVTADLARDVVSKLDHARLERPKVKPELKIPDITETLEQIIRKADVKTLWN